MSVPSDGWVGGTPTPRKDSNRLSEDRNREVDRCNYETIGPVTLGSTWPQHPIEERIDADHARGL